LALSASLTAQYAPCCGYDILIEHRRRRANGQTVVAPLACDGLFEITFLVLAALEQ
jgi:hypothetical protein